MPKAQQQHICAIHHQRTENPEGMNCWSLVYSDQTKNVAEVSKLALVRSIPVDLDVPLFAAPAPLAPHVLFDAVAE
jgi:hypothetical protein